MEGCSRKLSAHTCLPPGSTGTYFYLIWFSRHFCLTCLQVDLPINCLTSNLFTPSSLKWVRQPLFLTGPRARNIDTVMEFWEGGRSIQVKTHCGLTPNQSCAKNHPETFGSHCSVSCFCIQCVGGWLVELLCVVSVLTGIFLWSQTALETWHGFYLPLQNSKVIHCLSSWLLHVGLAQ